MEGEVKQMAKYSMIVFWSERDGRYLVTVPDLPECMADGQTPQEAVANAEIIIDEWLETAKMLGREIPEPSTYKEFQGTV